MLKTNKIKNNGNDCINLKTNNGDYNSCDNEVDKNSNKSNENNNCVYNLNCTNNLITDINIKTSELY